MFHEKEQVSCDCTEEAVALEEPARAVTIASRLLYSKMEEWREGTWTRGHWLGAEAEAPLQPFVPL